MSKHDWRKKDWTKHRALVPTAGGSMTVPARYYGGVGIRRITVARPLAWTNKGWAIFDNTTGLVLCSARNRKSAERVAYAVEPMLRAYRDRLKADWLRLRDTLHTEVTGPWSDKEATS
jgi:hypothetical protein